MRLKQIGIAAKHFAAYIFDQNIFFQKEHNEEKLWLKLCSKVAL